MKRLQVNLAVADLDASVRFHASLFDARPTVPEDDYANLTLDRTSLRRRLAEIGQSPSGSA